jgi:hypothetical protein
MGFSSKTPQKYNKFSKYANLFHITTNNHEIFSHFGSVVAESIER